jgi:hypothetical protein
MLTVVMPCNVTPSHNSDLPDSLLCYFLLRGKIKYLQVEEGAAYGIVNNDTSYVDVIFDKNTAVCPFRFVIV